MCQRFVELLEKHLDVSDAEAARALGYVGTGTLWKIRRGTAFVDVERLATLASMGRANRPNLHWLLTGRGSPLIVDSGDEAPEILKLHSRLSREKQRALITLMSRDIDRSSVSSGSRRIRRSHS